MNTSFLKNSLPALALLGLAACQPELDAPTVDKGSADFSRYISIGNSLTAGFADNGLYLEGQQSSYPSILAQQFSAAGGGEFVQPLFPADKANGSGFVKLLSIDASGSPVTTTVPGNAGRNPGAADKAPYVRFDQPINNLGIPGIRMVDVQTAGYGSLAGNAYFERITPVANPLETYFQRVKREAATATFFTTWLGSNDVLGYATAGGASPTATVPSSTTDTSFIRKSARILNVLTANGAKGVVSTVPDVTGIPFFTTVGPRLKANLIAKNVPGMVLQTGFNPGGPTTANRKPIATTDIRDASGGRQLFTLGGSAAAGLIGTATGKPWRDVYKASGNPPAGFGAFLTTYGVDTTALFGVTAQNPFPSAYVLDDVEQATVATATNYINSTLRTQAAAKNLVLFDVNVFFAGVALNGYATNGVNNNTSYIRGNIFSLDGVHLTPRGNAVIANEMIKVINAKYGSTLQQVDPNTYRGILLP
ncbi:GDSL-like Lipase/Acylhydrolase [Hymenobacter daecheongensis DSM 21074]|uniref:GDSL-like Lipase/Acylhydrolase n=1 Tax=Hymenobacter daecheongensis DSM 21074 TaxID=1121955 RepID=A0A1M6AFN4_9BACT|nr:hypothetical protein [Hymenobacter daecheongensis]SHI35354.1 GDSL-like Lipase/Acylhydrolase [Hymenobacter daecheongensis DSM 21074]